MAEMQQLAASARCNARRKRPREWAIAGLCVLLVASILNAAVLHGSYLGNQNLFSSSRSSTDGIRGSTYNTSNGGGLPAPTPLQLLKRSAVTVLRSIIFPLLRPRCLPSGQLPPDASDLTFALTMLYLPANGPAKWTSKARDLLALSEQNKLKYCARGDVCTYINGTAFAEDNYSRGIHLDNVRGAERGVWFKPIYIRELLYNVTIAADWILYMDADSIIMNHNFDLRSLLAGTGPDDALIISPDAENRINTGVFLIRNNDLGRIIVNAWTADRDAMARMNDQAYLADMFDEDGHLIVRYMPAAGEGGNNGEGETQRPRMKIIRQCAMQSGGGLEGRPDHQSFWPYWEGTYARGDFAVHFFGRPDKLEQMRLAATGSIGFWS